MPVISTNNAANASLNYLNQNSSKETSLLSQLASGSRIVNASDDAAGLAIGTQLQANATVYQQDSVNVQQGTSMLQAADGALAQISNVLQRMQALATEAASGQVTDDQRSDDINKEFQQLYTEITSIVSSTKYANKTLLDANSIIGSTSFIVGTASSDTISVSANTIDSTNALGLSADSVSTATAAKTAMTDLTTAINSITQYRAKIGAYESQLSYSSQTISTNVQNVTAAASTIMDADVAAVKASLSAVDVKTQAAVAALAQAAQLPQELLKLIQS